MLHLFDMRFLFFAPMTLESCPSSHSRASSPVLWSLTVSITHPFTCALKLSLSTALFCFVNMFLFSIKEKNSQKQTLSCNSSSSRYGLSSLHNLNFSRVLNLSAFFASLSHFMFPSTASVCLPGSSQLSGHQWLGATFEPSASSILLISPPNNDLLNSSPLPPP